MIKAAGLKKYYVTDNYEVHALDGVKLTKAFLTTGLDLGNTLQLIFAVLLLILGVLVAIQGVKKLLEKTDDKKATA